MLPLILLWLSFQYIFTVWSFNKSMRLNSTYTHLNASGIHLAITTDHIDIINNMWHINPPTQADTDLEILLNDNWGFHSSIESTISIIVYGFTPNTTELNPELLMLFAVNKQYFSLAVMLQQNQPWKSYPSFTNSSLAITNNVLTDIISQNMSTRSNRISNNGTWVNIGQTSYTNALEWPLHIQITNDPIHNITHYKCILPNTTLNGVFTTSFDTNKGMNIYIMNSNDDNKPFDIQYMEISYSYNYMNTILMPSTMPTIAPSTYPTFKPVEEGRVDEQLETTDTTQPQSDLSTSKNNKILWIVIFKSKWITIVVIATSVCVLCCISGIVIKIFVNKCINVNTTSEKKPMEISKPTLNALPSQSQIIQNKLTNIIAMTNGGNHQLVPMDIENENENEQNMLSSGDELFETHVTGGGGGMSIAQKIPLQESDDEELGEHNI